MLRYRGSEGMLAWAFHRISGVAIWVFILLHVFDIWLAGANPTLYDDVLQVYASPGGRVARGAPRRGAAVPLAERPADHHHGLLARDDPLPPQLWYACWVVFVIVGHPGRDPDHGAGLRVRAAVHVQGLTMRTRDPVRFGEAPGRRLGAGRSGTACA